MPRRIPDYPDAYTEWNAISSFGSIVSLIASLLFFYTIYRTFADLNDQEVILDQIQATKHFFDDAQDLKTGIAHTSLEWTLDNPPVLHTFEQQPYLA
jgi:heme/copper-type cytochrome/quinol oxidase subunit 1